jgi:uncharacterized RDD family membrane protein YckC
MSDPTAVMGRRIVAFVIDIVIAWGIFFGIAAATTSYDTLSEEAAQRAFGRGDMCSGVNETTDGDATVNACTLTISLPDGTVLEDRLVVFYDGKNYVIETGSTAAAWGAVLVYWLLVFVIWQGVAGVTPGKGLLGLRAVNEDGDAPGIGRAFIRSLLMIVDSLCCYLVGLIAAMTSKGHRRVGDMAAKTFVVGKDAKGAGPVSVPGMAPPAPAYAAATSPSWGTSPPMTPPVAGEPVDAPPAAGEPQWDAARNAYIQWDTAQQKWLQFDDATQQWRPID